MNYEDVFEYRDGALYWRIRPAMCVRVGDRAGTEMKDGYRRIKHAGVQISEHRLIWEMHNGPIPNGMEIDHIDGVRSNNVVSNLRLATKQQNAWNRKSRDNSTSKYKGVFWWSQAEKWAACLLVEGRQKWLGTFDNERDAALMVNAAAIDAWGDFARLNEVS